MTDDRQPAAPGEDCPAAPRRPGRRGPDFAIAALDALAALEAAQIGQLQLALRFGATLDVAKDRLRHGSFRGWCTELLRRSPSWCAAHLRLYRQRGNLEEALAWAVTTGHRWTRVNAERKAAVFFIVLATSGSNLLDLATASSSKFGSGSGGSFAALNNSLDAKACNPVPSKNISA